MRLSKKNTFGTSLSSVITASSVGTLIEWYDFFVFGSLAVLISGEFFPKTDPAASFLATLATFSAGLIVRPAGALLFGRLGDRVGRKHTFMITLMIMGLSTVGIGFVPGYEHIGFWAPVIVLVLRLLQGLALGGEYGGATVYIAEHAPARRTGFLTSWIQTTSGMAFILSVAVILLVKSIVSETVWHRWGWRIPFWVSLLLVIMSVYIRNKMSESPLFDRLRSEGKTSVHPIRESFYRRENLKTILLAFLGLTLGIGAIGWITFYAQNFLLKTAGLDFGQANAVIITGILLGMPFFPVFGWLSDRLGRRNLLIAGMILGVFLFRPAFNNMYHVVSAVSLERTPVSITGEIHNAATNQDSEMVTTVTRKIFSDRSEQIEVSTHHKSIDATPANTVLTVKVSPTDRWKLIFWVFILQFIFTMAYGPLGAYMVEMFPARIRYTSVSFPYHFGFGIFGGLAPYFASYLVQKAGEHGRPDFYLSGLQYPVLLSAVSIVIGFIYLPDDWKPGNKLKISPAFVNFTRRGLGVLWILLALLTFWFGAVKFGFPKIYAGTQEDLIFGLILTFLITPISSTGLLLFGIFALRGEYNHRGTTERRQ